MARPRIEEIVWDVLGAAGSGPTGYPAARKWGVATQVLSSFQVETLWSADPMVESFSVVYL